MIGGMGAIIGKLISEHADAKTHLPFAIQEQLSSVIWRAKLAGAVNADDVKRDIRRTLPNLTADQVDQALCYVVTEVHLLQDSSTQQNPSAINAQRSAEDQKQQMERWKILQDTQTEVFKIQQDVTMNKAQTQDKAYKKWDEYVRN
jgi:hypothetical protein